MKSGQICETSIETIGPVRGRPGVKFQWKIGNGLITINRHEISSYYGANNTDSRIWNVSVSNESLDKVIEFLQKVRKETRKKRAK